MEADAGTALWAETEGRNLTLTLQILHGYEAICVSGMKTHHLICVLLQDTLLCLVFADKQELPHWSTQKKEVVLNFQLCWDIMLEELEKWTTALEEGSDPFPSLCKKQLQLKLSQEIAKKKKKA